MRLKISTLALYALLIFSCSKKHTPVTFSSSHYDPSALYEDTLAFQSIFPYSTKLNQEMSEVLVVSEDEFIKGQPESNLGNFVTDCLMKRAKNIFSSKGFQADIVMMNNGGLRASLPKGNITKGKIFELMPFDNQMVLVVLNGKKVMDLIDFIAQKGGVPVSGLVLELKKENQVQQVKINGFPLDTTKAYGIVTSDYLALGGDNIRFFKNEKIIYTNELIRDILIEHCRSLGSSGKKLKSTVDGRISISK